MNLQYKGMQFQGKSQLTPEQLELFERTYARHMSGFGTEARKKYEGKVKTVKWDAKERCLKVYYENGEWWHYGTDGTWW
jgi:ribosomal protein L44E